MRIRFEIFRSLPAQRSIEMGPKEELSHEERVLANRMKEEDLTDEQIAKIMGLPLDFIHQHFHPPLTEDQKDDLVELWRDRINPESIAERMKLPVYTVRKEMKRLLLID